MKTKLSIYILLLLVAAFSCKKGDTDPYRQYQSKAAILAGDWKLNSFKVDGIEKDIFIELIKSEQGSCDTQYLTHIDSILYQQYTFGQKGNYFRSTDIVRIDSSYLSSNIIDTACTNKYNFYRPPFDTTLQTKGFWTFPGIASNDLDLDRILIFDTNLDSAEIWDIINLSETEIRLHRRYYDQNDIPVEEDLHLLPK